MKTFILVANLLAICLATEDLKADESMNTSIRKPLGQPLQIHGEVPAVEQSRPQFEYISADNQDEAKPVIDYISTPNAEQRPTVEYISRKPATFDYISSYPSYNGYNSYNSYGYSGYPQVSYALPQSGSLTGYQYIRSAPVETRRQPLTRSYNFQHTYYPLQSTYQQYQYGYQYPQYISQYPKYQSQYFQPLQYTYVPIIPLKKKK